jgi:phosphoribosylaminoimidazolecarboxamide formyltransferase / IMP cyclohydrolase
MIKNVLVSVFDKRGVLELSEFMTKRGVTVYSTGGSYKLLSTHINPNFLKEVSSLTEFPELLDGRVKTLHPKIHGGLLAKRDNPEHMAELKKYDIPMIDMVIVNLYPFQEVVNSSLSEDIILENIDIGGHTLIRASAKNYHNVLTVVDPSDYEHIMKNWDRFDEMRHTMAKKAWYHVTSYDMAISGYFNKDHIYRSYANYYNLKYGTNPQQRSAACYKQVGQPDPFKVLNGNVGYINVLDAIYGWNLVNDLKDSLGQIATASYKHNSPAGVGLSVPLSDMEKKIYFVGDRELSPIATSYCRARNTDPMCSFGDFIATGGIVDEIMAKLLSADVSDGIIAPAYSPEAFDILSKKKGGQFVILEGDPRVRHSYLEIREFHGLMLVQDENMVATTFSTLSNIVTHNQNLTEEEKMDLILANITLKYTQSNSVCSTYKGQTLGVGAGQQSRIDCVKLVKKKTELWYLRQHPKCLELISQFKKGVRKVDKINAIVKYIEGDFGEIEYQQWCLLFEQEPSKLSNEDKESFLKTLGDISVASDAFFPFRDSIDVAAKFGVKNIIHPGGSVADNLVVDGANEYNMVMIHSGKDTRLFLH